MPRFNNNRPPQGNDWFDWLPRKVQCALLLSILLPATALFFGLGMHCVHMGRAIVLGNSQLDAGECFLSFAVLVAISGGIFGVMMGWMKSATPHISETHHRRK
jgi:ABC-type sulfate transport system permease component